MPARLRLAVMVTCVVVVAAACSGNDDATPVTLSPSTTTPTPTTAAPTTAATSAPTTEPTPAGPPLEDAASVWTEVVTAVASSGEDPAGPSAAAGATAAVVEQLELVFGEGKRIVTSFPTVEEQDDETVLIDDCMFVGPSLAAAPTAWFSGIATATDGAWTITAVNVESLEGCVPTSIADAALADYDAYHDARASWLDPPDAAAAELAATATGDFLALNQDLATRLAGDGQVLRGRATTHPEFFRINSPTEVVVLDCTETDPERGVYDADTGERTDVIAPIADGQRDLLETTMILEDDTWKVADVQANRNTTCETAPTVQGLPVAGG